MQPVTYLCILSEFNLPELEACLQVQPDHLVLIVSNYYPAQAGAQRLATVVTEALPQITLHRPDQQVRSFDGEDIRAIQDWVIKVLEPYLQHNTPASNVRILNITGGTKAQSLVISRLLNYTALHYKGIGQNNIQVIQGDPPSWPVVECLQPSTPTPLQVARLYAGAVHHHASLIDQLPEPDKAIQLAADIWQALEQRDPALLALFSALEELWYGKDAIQSKALTLPLQRFTGDAMPGKWINRFSALLPKHFCLRDGQLHLPGNRASGTGKQLRKWISGEWLEALAGYWLTRAGLTEQDFISNLEISPNKGAPSEARRETDLFVHHKGRSYLIEIKADLANNSAGRQAHQQVASLGNRLGRTKKILLLGPQATHSLDERGMELLKVRLDSSGITLCCNRQQLLKALGLT